EELDVLERLEHLAPQFVLQVENAVLAVLEGHLDAVAVDIAGALQAWGHVATQGEESSSGVDAARRAASWRPARPDAGRPTLAPDGAPGAAATQRAALRWR